MRKNLTDKVIVNIFKNISEKVAGFHRRTDMPLYDCNDIECLFIAQRVCVVETPHE